MRADWHCFSSSLLRVIENLSMTALATNAWATHLQAIRPSVDGLIVVANACFLLREAYLLWQVRQTALPRPPADCDFRRKVGLNWVPGPDEGTP